MSLAAVAILTLRNALENAWLCLSSSSAVRLKDSHMLSVSYLGRWHFCLGFGWMRDSLLIPGFYRDLPRTFFCPSLTLYLVLSSEFNSYLFMG